MRIALAQINPRLGAYAENAAKIIDFARRAREKRADIVIFSECALFAYPPYDLLERREQVKMETAQIKKITAALPKGITAIFGAVVPNDKAAKIGGKAFWNAAVVAQKGKKPQFFAKQVLPSYDVFDDTRFFEPGQETGVVKIPGVGRVAVTVCEDMWVNMTEGGTRIYHSNPLAKLGKVDLIVNISASPFARKKMKARLEAASFHCKKLKVPLAYANQVGGQDELVFDGRSFVMDKNGKVIVEAAPFAEDLVIVDLEQKRWEYRPEEKNPSELLRQALVTGIRDYVKKTGQRSVHLGLSGGIDSSVVAALAVDALGPSRVIGVLMPGPYSSESSVTDALALAKNLGIQTYTIDIKPMYETAHHGVEIFVDTSATAGAQGVNRVEPSDPKSRKAAVSILEQNLQARLRGTVLMAYANAAGSMLLSTSNKSELATGYSTLYGDTNGGLMPIGDLLKGEVYEIARLYNRDREIIPASVIEKAPSAELAPGQVDQDNLPPYDELDLAVRRVVEERREPSNSTERWLLGALARSEFKRWQAPPILRISAHGFGRGRRMPIAVAKESLSSHLPRIPLKLR